MKDIGRTKSLVKPSRQTKIQTQSDIQIRHLAEKQWNEEFYNDLSIQLRFERIMLVQPQKIQHEKMFPDSQSYVAYYNSKKYKSLQKKDPTVKKDLSHFVALTDRNGGFTRLGKKSKNSKSNYSTGNDHVICEDYFVAKTEFGKATNIRRVSKKQSKNVKVIQTKYLN